MIYRVVFLAVFSVGCVAPAPSRQLSPPKSKSIDSAHRPLPIAPTVAPSTTASQSPKVPKVPLLPPRSVRNLARNVTDAYVVENGTILVHPASSGARLTRFAEDVE